MMSGMGLEKKEEYRRLLIRFEGRIKKWNMIKRFAERLKQEFKGYNVTKLGKDLMSGITVAAVALPLALAFGVSSGADAAAGLITAIIAGFLISAFSGASYQISGPTGAMTAVLITIVSKYTLQGVFLVSLIAGILLLIAGLCKLGKLVSIIPMPVVAGFTSGIAIIIALGQIDNFFGTTSQGESAIAKLLSYGELGFSPDWRAVAIGVLVVAIMLLWPKKWNAKVPSSLIAIVIAAIACSLLGFDIAIVGAIPKTLLPAVRLDLFSIDFSVLPQLISPAITVAALGMIESLLCGASASRMKDEKFDADQELVAQGIGNMVIPFFGGVPATAAIARTSVAIKSGAQTRLAGIFHAAGLLASMFLLSDVMSQLPMSALAGVLMVTAWRMNEWHSIQYIFKNKFKSAMAQFLVTMVCTVIFDLTVAIVVGVLLAMVLFVTNAITLRISTSKVENNKLHVSEANVEGAHRGTVVIYIVGMIFFANVEQLRDRLAEIEAGNMVILSMRGVSGIDMGGALELLEIIEEYQGKGMEVLLCGVQENVKTMLKRVDQKGAIPEEKYFWSVDKALLQ